MTNHGKLNLYNRPCRSFIQQTLSFIHTTDLVVVEVEWERAKDFAVVGTSLPPVRRQFRILTTECQPAFRIVPAEAEAEFYMRKRKRKRKKHSPLPPVRGLANQTPTAPPNSTCKELIKEIDEGNGRRRNVSYRTHTNAHKRTCTLPA